MTHKDLYSSQHEWWRGGVIYQIYPRSFQDSNSDGIGDLIGVTQRLDYIASLGVDAIWLSPFFKSPMKDFGYDVSDYCDVDPMFGTIADFKQLIHRAHQLNLKVMIDQVLSHTSDQHPWFAESRSSKKNPKADWYVWADAKPDGTPPNNWLSVFGGSAWHWDTRRCQYYMHNFLTSQPDLNFHHPEVRSAILSIVKFWLELGVDGYRLDTANFFFHDPLLRDNPARGAPSADEFDPTVNPVNPYGWQWHVYDKSRPENLGFLKEIRSLLDQYPDTTMVGEVGDDDGLARVAEYTQGGDKLHMAYCFDLLSEQHNATYFYDLLANFNQQVRDGWPCWALSNHDVIRVASRWGGEKPSPMLLKTAAKFLMSLRGSVCLYQGEELGLPEAEIAYEDLQDPYGITMWPQFKGRDGCRTPMPWNEHAIHAGFSDAERTWLPVSADHLLLSVENQQKNCHSLLNYFRKLIAWRRQQPELIHGDMTLLASHPQVLAYIRGHEKNAFLCVFNFSSHELKYEVPEDWKDAINDFDGIESGVLKTGRELLMQPWSSVLLHRLPETLPF